MENLEHFSYLGQFSKAKTFCALSLNLIGNPLPLFSDIMGENGQKMAKNAKKWPNLTQNCKNFCEILQNCGGKFFSDSNNTHMTILRQLKVKKVQKKANIEMSQLFTRHVKCTDDEQ